MPTDEGTGVAAFAGFRAKASASQSIGRLKAADPLSRVLWVTDYPDTRQARECSNFAKNDAILQKHEQAKFPMPVTSGSGACGGVENINTNSDPV
jgi:hypothetical protein